MKTFSRRTVGLGAAALALPFIYVVVYLTSTRGGNLHSATPVDLFFLCIGLGIGCVLLWGLPCRSSTKIMLVLPYIVVVGGSSFLFGFWLLRTFYGIGP